MECRLRFNPLAWASELPLRSFAQRQNGHVFSPAPAESRGAPRHQAPRLPAAWRAWKPPEGSGCRSSVGFRTEGFSALRYPTHTHTLSPCRSLGTFFRGFTLGLKHRYSRRKRGGALPDFQRHMERLDSLQHFLFCSSADRPEAVAKQQVGLRILLQLVEVHLSEARCCQGCTALQVLASSFAGCPANFGISSAWNHNALHPGASTPRQEKRRAPPAKVASQVMYKHCASIQ